MDTQKMEMIMRKAFILLAAALLALPLEAQEYSLPRTVLRLEVEAEQEIFYAGPYARYASKYLGIDARESDESVTRLVSVRLEALTEADQSARYVLPQAKEVPAFMKLSTQGLVSLGGSVPAQDEWRFPAVKRSDFETRGVASNLTSESATLYRRDGSEGRTVSVQQQMVVEKSADQRAKETADIIFDLRAKRRQIVTGDTDATFSGEALGAAVAEIDRLEKEYMSMFIGYSVYRQYNKNYDVIPNKGAKNQRYIAFRVSDTDGLVEPEDIGGKPYILELQSEKISAPDESAAKPSKGPVVYYRIPAICTARLTDGSGVLLRTRVPVYQLGADSTMPIK